MERTKFVHVYKLYAKKDKRVLVPTVQIVYWTMVWFRTLPRQPHRETICMWVQPKGVVKHYNQQLTDWLLPVGSVITREGQYYDGHDHVVCGSFAVAVPEYRDVVDGYVMDEERYDQLKTTSSKPFLADVKFDGQRYVVPGCDDDRVIFELACP